MKERCEWCNQPTSELTYLQQSGAEKHMHRRCYALMYNYARRFQELKDILSQPDIVEIQTDEKLDMRLNKVEARRPKQYGLVPEDFFTANRLQVKHLKEVEAFRKIYEQDRRQKEQTRKKT